MSCQPSAEPLLQDGVFLATEIEELPLHKRLVPVARGRILVHQHPSIAQDAPDQAHRRLIQEHQIEFIAAQGIGEQADKVELGLGEGRGTAQEDGDVDIR